MVLPSVTDVSVVTTKFSVVVEFADLMVVRSENDRVPSVPAIVENSVVSITGVDVVASRPGTVLVVVLMVVPSEFWTVFVVSKTVELGVTEILLVKFGIDVTVFAVVFSAVTTVV